MYRTLHGIRDDGIGLYFPLIDVLGPSGLGALGNDDCKQPVPTEQRDSLRAELARWVNDYYAQTPAKGPGWHWHEGHPDIKAYLADIIPRMDGLKPRAKLLRCNAEARKRAQAWIGNMKDLMGKIKRGGMTVIPAGGIAMPLHRGRVYQFRGPWYDGKFQPVGGGAPIPKPPAPGPGPGGEEGEGGRAPGQATPTIPGLPPAAAGIWESLTTGEFYGVPREYITYGAIALLAYNFLKK